MNTYFVFHLRHSLPSVLWLCWLGGRNLSLKPMWFITGSGLCLDLKLRHCWLGIRKSTQPVKIEWWGVGLLALLSVWTEVQIVCVWSTWCHRIPKPHHFLPHLNPDWFYLSVTNLLKLSWKKGHWTCVVVVVVKTVDWNLSLSER